MNYQSNSIKALGFGTVLTALLFAVFAGLSPVQAHAQYRYGGYQPYSYPPVTYNRPQPIVYQQPQPIYIQQPPQIVYQQSQPIYVQQPQQIVYQQQPTYTQQYPALSASCYAQNTSAQTGTSVEWIASASGGNGSYTYSWSGTDSFYSNSSYNAYAYMTYYNAGYKTAMVTVYSNGQSQTVNCNSSVNVYSSYAYYQQPTTYVQPVTYVQQPTVAYAQSSNASLDIGCYADPTTATANQPVTWTAEVTGGVAPYTYSWTGSDGLSGTGSSVTQYYSTSGSKNAIVAVTSANGMTGTRACSNSLAVRSTASNVAYAPRQTQPSQTTTQTTTTTTQPGQQQQSTVTNAAASALSIGNIPWGWVAILVILVLFATIIYLLFNRPKM
jgi:hypothetical protein